MILFTALLIMILAVAIVLFAGGMAGLLVFGDLIICVGIIGFIINLVIKKKRAK